MLTLIGIMTEEKDKTNVNQPWAGTPQQLALTTYGIKSPDARNGNGNHTREENHHSSGSPDDFHTTHRHGQCINSRNS